MTQLERGEFVQRRRQLMGAMEPGSIALVPGAVMQWRNRDIDYAFRQNSDLLYLGGFGEPDAVLITESECEVLSRRIPKTADEIEALMRAL